jgi:multimeric flavodoxin WrbA
MKIICLLGSPRTNGNSTTLANRFIETAVRLGAETRTFELNQLTYRGCQGCGACKTSLDTCALKDDLTEVLEAIKKSEVLVLATPVYFRDIPGQVKCFMDRTFSFLVPDYITNPKCSRVPPGKKLVFIITQGSPDEEMFADIPKRYDFSLKRVLALAEVYLIRACGVGGGGIAKGVPEKFLQQAEETARVIITRL